MSYLDDQIYQDTMTLATEKWAALQVAIDSGDLDMEKIAGPAAPGFTSRLWDIGSKLFKNTSQAFKGYQMGAGQSGSFIRNLTRGMGDTKDPYGFTHAFSDTLKLVRDHPWKATAAVAAPTMAAGAAGAGMLGGAYLLGKAM